MNNAQRYLKDGVIYHELACDIAVFMSNSIKKRSSTTNRRFFQTTSKAITKQRRRKHPQRSKRCNIYSNRER